MKPPLSGRQQQIVSEIAGYRERHGYAPSLREIAKAVGLSPSTVDHQLKVLEGRGYLTRGPWGTPRSWTVVP